MTKIYERYDTTLSMTELGRKALAKAIIFSVLKHNVIEMYNRPELSLLPLILPPEQAEKVQQVKAQATGALDEAIYRYVMTFLSDSKLYTPEYLRPLGGLAINIASPITSADKCSAGLDLLTQLVDDEVSVVEFIDICKDLNS